MINPIFKKDDVISKDESDNNKSHVKVKSIDFDKKYYILY